MLNRKMKYFFSDILYRGGPLCATHDCANVFRNCGHPGALENAEAQEKVTTVSVRLRHNRIPLARVVGA
jgi:hypothetical protein